VPIEDQGQQPVGVVAGWHLHRRQGVRVLGRLPAQDLEAPGADRRADGVGQARVPLEHLLEPLLEEHVERLAQAVEHVRRRRVGEEAILVLLDDRPPVVE